MNKQDQDPQRSKDQIEDFHSLRTRSKMSNTVITTKRYSLKRNLTQLAARGEDVALSAMLEEGVDDVDARSPNGSSPLMLAAKYGALSTVKLLLQHGAKTSAESLSIIELNASIANYAEITKALKEALCESANRSN